MQGRSHHRRGRPPASEAGRPLEWIALWAAVIAGGWLADRVGVPSSYLFSSILAGIAWALVRPGRLNLPPQAFRVGQAVTGVTIGLLVSTSTFQGLGLKWIAVVLISIATLATTIAAGIVLGRATGLDRATASLGLVAGGASGIVAMADELGADDRIVSFMQYLRVLVVTLTSTLLVPIAFGIHASGGGATSGSFLGTAVGWGVTVAVTLGGLAIAGRVRLPAATLLLPLFAAAALAIAGVAAEPDMPGILRDVGFALIGVGIGLSFERDTVRRIAQLLVPVAASIAGLMAVCAVLGWLLELTAGVSFLDGYLATTPGGLYAVLPVAYGSGANTTFVLTVQTLRLLMMIVAAPVIVRWLLTRARTPGPAVRS